MLVAYSEFAKPMRSLLSKSTEEAVTLWELFDLDPLPRWCEGTMALMGDAAHPYSPCKYSHPTFWFFFLSRKLAHSSMLSAELIVKLM